MTARSTTTRDRHRAVIKRRRDPCHICGEPIDYTLPYLHPLEFVADHIVPLNRGGTDVLDNKQAAHRTCNRTKSDKVAAAPIAAIVTTRSW